MSWLFSAVLVEEYLEANCLDGEQFVQSSGTHMQQAYCSPDKMTEFSKISQSGMMFAPLMENHGEALLMWYLEDFHAKTSQVRGGGQELMEKDQECGKRWQGSLAKFDPDLCLWKTVQCSLFEDLEQYLETWPRWGLMQDGECWEQTPLVPHIEGSEFGWWPTPVASDWMTGKVNGIEYRNRRFIRTSLTSGTEFGAKLADAFRLMTGKALPANFSEWMMGWPPEWTELKPLEMAKFQQWQQQHGKF